MTDSTKLVEVFFQLTPDEDDYPPVSVESVWARADAGSPGVIIDNVPFFAREATFGDLVQTRVEDGNLWFEMVLQHSRNSLVRVCFYEPDCVQRVRGHLEGMGCDVEYAKSYQLLSVSIPESVSLRDVQDYLQGEAKGGGIEYEEAILWQ